MAEKLIIGSRGSQLALWQARWVAARLPVPSELLIIKTTGDRITDVPLAKVGTKGLFTKELEEALLDHRIDVAVHSLKDMPTELPAGLMLAAVPEREDPRDAIVGKTLDELAAGSRVGTSSLRRAAQLKALRPDLQIEDIRGNLDTRLRKLDEGLYDSIVLAAAGLRRLGWGSRITQILPVEVMCPAVGQGSLAIETRAGGGQAALICALLTHEDTLRAVRAERAVLNGLGGGCQAPIGAHARIKEGRVRLRGVVARPDGSKVICLEAEGDASEPEAVGSQLARDLLAAGAGEMRGEEAR